MAEVSTIRTAAEQALAEAFGIARDSLPGTGDVQALRDTAFDAFRETGLPHRRVEEWKYTDLRALMRDAKPLAPAPDVKAIDEARNAGALCKTFAHLKLVIVDGVYAPQLSDAAILPAGVHFMPLAEALAAGDPAVMQRLGTLGPSSNTALSLNAAFMTDGVVLKIDEGTVVETPIHLAVIHTGVADQAVHVRSLFVLGRNASLTLFETYESPAGRADQTNVAIEIELGDGASLHRVAAQTESREALHLSSLMVSLGREAVLNSFALACGAAVSRNQVFLTYAGENAKALLAGATMLAGKRHADTTLVVDHKVPGGTSRERFKAILDDAGHAVFQGKIIVRPHAQKTDGRMMSQAILLSDNAEIDNKPELEIFADDVQCAHGATCGALDEDLVFYCMSRGLPKAEAEMILIEAFLGEVVDTVEHEGMRDALMDATRTWLAARA